jgi:hypothetical protein
MQSDLKKKKKNWKSVGGNLLKAVVAIAVVAGAAYYVITQT